MEVMAYIYPDNGDHVLSFDGQDDYLSISGVDAYNNLGDFSFRFG